MTMYIPKSKDKVFCEFVKITEVLWECSKCKQRIGSMEDGQDLPTLPCKVTVAKYTEEISKKHDEISSMISNRYAICQTCEFFKDNICSKCGCMISAVNTYINKLSDKKDKCPEGKW